MTSKQISVPSRLHPLTLQDRATLAIEAWNFFSPSEYQKKMAVLGLVPKSGSIEPLSAYQFALYLEKIGVFTDSLSFIHQIKGVLDAMEREGLLVVMGHGSFVMAPKSYYSLKQLTQMEKKGWGWLAPALGADFLYSYLGPHTVHIIGDCEGMERGGTGWIISNRHILTCAHVLTGMTVRPVQHFGGIDCEIKSVHAHPSIDVGIIELSEASLVVDPSIGFRDPVIGEQLYVLGYPPVPMAREAALILQGGEVVNQGIADYNGQEVFLYSAIARPGNSGGPIVAKSGQILGIVTEDRSNQAHPHALFFAGVSASTISHALSELPVDVELPIEMYL